MDRCGGFNPTRNREVSWQEIGFFERTPPDPCPVEKMGVFRNFDSRSIHFPLFNCSYFNNLLFHLITDGKFQFTTNDLSLICSIVN